MFIKDPVQLTWARVHEGSFKLEKRASSENIVQLQLFGIRTRWTVTYLVESVNPIFQDVDIRA